MRTTQPIFGQTQVGLGARDIDLGTANRVALRHLHALARLADRVVDSLNDCRSDRVRCGTIGLLIPGQRRFHQRQIGFRMADVERLLLLIRGACGGLAGLVLLLPPKRCGQLA